MLGIAVLALATISIADTKLNDGTVLSDSPTWIVTYIEVAVDAADDAAALISAQSTASRKEKGSLYFEGLQRVGQDNHFVMLEAWTDPDDRAEHAAANHTQSFRKALQPMLYAPYDERPHVGLESIAPQEIPKANDATIFVLTHADIIPPEQFAPCNRRPDPNGPCGNDLLTNLAKASRVHNGNLRFDVLTQSNRGNHMTVVEMWDSSATQAAHQIHMAKKSFRDQLAGIEAGSGVSPDPQFVLNMMTGSLWDERLYRLIDSPSRAVRD
jgi:quinol monooxygenase YgiN